MKYLKVVVTTGSKRESVEKKSEDHFFISVKERPERNLANKRVVELLALYFKVLPNKIRIINGHHHPHKLLALED